MQDQKPLIDRIKPGKVTRQEYAERPFDFYTLKQSGGEITIEESYNWETDKPRVVKIAGFKDPSQTFEKIALKVSDGIFTKDLLMSEGEYTKLMAAFPSTLTNLRGVTFKISRNGLDTKIEYLRTERQDLEGNAYNNTASQQTAKPEVPKQLNDYAIMLCEAVKTNNSYGIAVTPAILFKMADTIMPNRAMDVIQAAKAGGYITEHAEGFRGH